MSLTRRILTSSAQLTLANGLARALSIVSLPLLTHWLAPQAYGQAALASTLISLVSVIALMGMDMSYSRGFLSRQPPNGTAVETLLWRIAVAAAVVAGSVAGSLWLLHAHGDSHVRPDLALLVFLGATSSLLLAMAQTRSRLHHRHRRLAVAVAVGGLFATVISLLLASRLVPDERALLAGYVAAYLVPLAIMGMPGWQQLRKRSGLSPDAKRSVFLVGLPGIVTAPMYWVLSSSDRWFLERSVDSAAVGVYALACTFGQLGMMVNSALLAMWLPEATRVHEALERAAGDQQLGRLFTRLLLVMIVVWLGVAVLGSDLLRALTNERFHGGAHLVPWLASAVFFYGIYHLANTGLFLGRKLSWSACAGLITGIFSVATNALLIPLFGAAAAAATQSATFAVLAVTVWFLSHRVHPLPLPLRRISFALIFSLLAVIAGTRLPVIDGFVIAAIKLMFLLTISLCVLLILSPSVLVHAAHAMTKLLLLNGGDRR
jgi:O-antigen/teichoic acid export membrane protein